FQHSMDYATSSLFDSQLGIASSNRTLPTDDVNDPARTHTAGVPWLTRQIRDGNGSWLDGSDPDGLPPANDPPPPSGPAGVEEAAGGVDQVASDDPNSIFGPQGSGTNRYIPPQMELPYTIYFTNQSDANGPAQVITIQLDI